jgi:hypothetical protein
MGGRPGVSIPRLGPRACHNSNCSGEAMKMEPNQDCACAAAPPACPELCSCAPYGSFWPARELRFWRGCSRSMGAVMPSLPKLQKQRRGEGGAATEKRAWVPLGFARSGCSGRFLSPLRGCGGFLGRRSQDCACAALPPACPGLSSCAPYGSFWPARELSFGRGCLPSMLSVEAIMANLSHISLERGGRRAVARSCWIVRSGENEPRFVTCFVLS